MSDLCHTYTGCQVGERPVRDIDGAQDRRPGLRSARRYRRGERQDGDDRIRVSHDPRPSASVADQLPVKAVPRSTSEGRGADFGFEPLRLYRGKVQNGL